MVDNKIPPNDPDFIKAKNTVYAIQQHLNASKHKAQSQHQQHGSDTHANGVNGKLSRTVCSSL